MNLTQCIHDWSTARLERQRLEKFGGTQRCPYCNQLVQMRGEWSIREWERDPMLDVITCGTCGGKSLWRWEIAMIYIGPLEAPKPKHTPAPHYDIANARLRTTS